MSVAQLYGDSFLSLVQRHRFLQLPPIPQDQCLIPVALLQAISVAQLYGDSFLSLMQRHRFLQLPPIPQD